MTSIGYATLQIIPSFQGVSDAVNKQLGFMPARGKAVGKDFAKSIASGMASDKSIEKATEAKAKATDKVADALGKVKVAQAQLNEAESRGNIAGRARALEAVASAERKVAAETRAQASAAKDLERAVKSADDAKKRLNSATGPGFLSGSGFDSKLEGFASKFSSAGGASGAAFVAGAGAAILAGGLIALGTKAAGLVAEGFESVVDAGVAFDKTFNNFQAVTNSSTSQMAAFRSEAIALGGDTQIAGANASDAATAMTELAKAGFTVDQAMAGARGTLQLAAAAQISAAEAATIEGNALNTFGLNADQAGRAADVLANVANASSGEMTDFANGLQQGGAVANQFGISIEDTAATLGLLANNGIKGSDAGTLLKSALLALASPSDQAGQALDELGVNAFDANGNFVGMRAIFDQLNVASKKLTPEMYAMSASTAFGSDAARLAGVAASKGADGFDTMRTAVEKQGTAAQVAATQNQGLPGVIENIKNTVDTLKLSLYDVIAGPLQDALGPLSASISTHKPELIAVFTDIGLAAVSMAEFVVKSTGLVAEGVGELISPLTATIAALLRGVAAFERIGGFTDLADDLDGAADSVSGFSQGLVDFGEKAKNVSLSGLYGDIQTAGQRAQEAAKFTRDLGGNLALLPDQKTVVLTAPTKDVLDGIDKTKYAIEAIPGTKDFKVIAKTDEATGEVNSWIQQQTGKGAELSVGANMALANQDVKRWGDQLALGGGISIPVRAAPPGAPLRIGTGFAGGGYTGNAPANRVAGVVHGDEFVIKSPSRARIESANPGLLDFMNTTGQMPGFAGGGLVGPDVLAAQAMAGTPYSQGNRTDCSGMAARVIARALGLPETGLMTTKNAQQWLSAAGFQPGTGGPGQISVGWYDHGPGNNDGHMAMTLSDGTNAEAGGKNGVFTLGAGASGANSPQFDQHMFLPSIFGEGQAGSFAGGSASGGGGVAGIGPNGESGTYSAPSAKTVREADEKVADADARVARAEAKQKELKADAKDSQRQAAQDDVDKAKREAADARADAEEAKKGKFTADKGGDGSGSGSKFSLSSSFSGFGSAIGEFAGGQIGSALGVLGIPDSPPFLQAASQLIGGISVGGSASPLSASSSFSGAPADAAGNILHGTMGGQAPGPTYNIQTAQIPDAFNEAQRREKVRMAAMTDRY